MNRSPETKEQDLYWGGGGVLTQFFLNAPSKYVQHGILTSRADYLNTVGEAPVYFI